MRELRIVDRARRILARVAWTPPARINLHVERAVLRGELEAWLDGARARGVPLHRAREVERSGRAVIVDEQITVMPDDERFLGALADQVSRYTFGGQRAFGLLTEVSDASERFDGGGGPDGEGRR